MNLQTDDSHLIILQGQVADDPDDEDIPVGENGVPFSRSVVF